jgi:hypothetical protein
MVGIVQKEIGFADFVPIDQVPQYEVSSTWDVHRHRVAPKVAPVYYAHDRPRGAAINLATFPSFPCPASEQPPTRGREAC